MFIACNSLSESVQFKNMQEYVDAEIETGNVTIVFLQKLLVILGAAQCAGSKPRAPAFLSACPQKYSLDNLKLRPFRMYNLKEFDSREVHAFQNF